MKKIIKEHLENITADNLVEFKYDCFSSMASFTSARGIVNIGCSATGDYLVKRKNETWRFYEPFSAIEKYTELISI